MYGADRLTLPIRNLDVHVLSRDPHMVQSQEAMVYVVKAHLGPDVSNSDS